MPKADLTAATTGPRSKTEVPSVPIGSIGMIVSTSGARPFPKSAMGSERRWIAQTAQATSSATTFQAGTRLRTVSAADCGALPATSSTPSSIWPE
jgi:hypothetical protein